MMDRTFIEADEGNNLSVQFFPFHFHTAFPYIFIENEGSMDYEVRKMKDVDSELG